MQTSLPRIQTLQCLSQKRLADGPVARVKRVWDAARRGGSCLPPKVRRSYPGAAGQQKVPRLADKNSSVLEHHTRVQKGKAPENVLDYPLRSLHSERVQKRVGSISVHPNAQSLAKVSLRQSYYTISMSTNRQLFITGFYYWSHLRQSWRPIMAVQEQNVGF